MPVNELPHDPDSGSLAYESKWLTGRMCKIPSFCLSCRSTTARRIGVNACCRTTVVSVILKHDGVSGTNRVSDLTRNVLTQTVAGEITTLAFIGLLMLYLWGPNALRRRRLQQKKPPPPPRGILPVPEKEARAHRGKTIVPPPGRESLGSDLATPRWFVNRQHSRFQNSLGLRHRKAAATDVEAATLHGNYIAMAAVRRPHCFCQAVVFYEGKG